MLIAFEKGDVAGLRFTDGPGRMDSAMAVAVDRAVDQLRQLSDGDAHGYVLPCKPRVARGFSAPADWPCMVDKPRKPGKRKLPTRGMDSLPRECHLPWAIKFPVGHETHPAGSPALPVHPTEIYESLLSFGLFGFLSWLYGRKKFDGQIFAAYLVCYALLRSFVEVFRGEIELG